ncbi:Peptidase C1 and/or Inhibitor I29 domain containing protein [Asbolus verrucosus]|uniref:Peptidase C1 and/or Inhibitor I29 domain containing protein n=1 Tax=Asbolus verrucosus TaxID=1661398 RepID=A0A482VQC2_ASBVE|nr:Peptidase C1 and/or Inhibitor I29 domain containing protein [Asbolus verrucosus]
MLQTDYNKVYTSPAQEASRFQIFKDNLNLIKEHNDKYNRGLVSYKLGITPFADMNEDDFSTYSNKPQQKSPPDAKASASPKRHVFVAATKDWRDEQVITKVRDQTFSCASSWAFAAAAAIESNLAIENGRLYTLSPQNLIDCVNNEGVDTCKSGSVKNAFHYVRSKGIMTEAEYPYTAHQDVCSFVSNKSVTNIVTYREVPSGSEEQLQEVVSDTGLVAAAIHATRHFFLYKGGHFYDTTCNSDVRRLNYAVLVVGYNYEERNEYWILKNSMGKRWGIDGYMHLARNRENNCGIATAAYYPVFH